MSTFTEEYLPDFVCLSLVALFYFPKPTSISHTTSRCQSLRCRSVESSAALWLATSTNSVQGAVLLSNTLCSLTLGQHNIHLIHLIHSVNMLSTWSSTSSHGDVSLQNYFSQLFSGCHGKVSSVILLISRCSLLLSRKEMFDCAQYKKNPQKQ